MISVVIPAYNASSTIEMTLRSVFEQTVLPDEIVIVDNASTDQTPTLLQNLKEVHREKLRILRVEKNVGPAGARNLGWKAAKSPYISFLDADDTWEKTKIEKTLKRLNEGFNLICHWEFLKENGQVLQVLEHGKHINLTYLTMLFGENQMSTSAVTVSRDLLEKANGFNERKDYLSAEDLDLWLRLLKMGAKVSFIEEPLGSFILYPQSTSASVVRHMEAIQRVIDDHYKALTSFNPTLPVKYLNKKARVMWGAGRHLQKQNLASQALQYYAQSLKTMPLSWRPYHGLSSCTLQVLKGLRS